MLPARTIRLRLTLWYGGFFLLAGALLVTLNFVLVSRNLPESRAEPLRDPRSGSASPRGTCNCARFPRARAARGACAGF